MEITCWKSIPWSHGSLYRVTVCSTGALSFSGDKRGHQAQLFKEIADNLQPRLDGAQVRLLCDPALVAYAGVGNGGDKSGALLISDLVWLKGGDVLVVCAGVDLAFCLMPTLALMNSLPGRSLSRKTMDKDRLIGDRREKNAVV